MSIAIAEPIAAALADGLLVAVQAADAGFGCALASVRSTAGFGAAQVVVGKGEQRRRVLGVGWVDDPAHARGQRAARGGRDRIAQSAGKSQQKLNVGACLLPISIDAQQQ